MRETLEEGDGGFVVEGEGGAGGLGELGFTATLPHVGGVDEAAAPNAQERTGFKIVGEVGARG